jgi:hypothetical protein
MKRVLSLIMLCLIPFAIGLAVPDDPERCIVGATASSNFYCDPDPPYCWWTYDVLMSRTYTHGYMAGTVELELYQAVHPEMILLWSDSWNWSTSGRSYEYCDSMYLYPLNAMDADFGYATIEGKCNFCGVPGYKCGFSEHACLYD